VIDGVIRPKMKIRLMAEKQDYEVLELGVFSPKAIPVGRARRRRSRLRRWPTSRWWPTPRSATPSPRRTGPTTEPFPGFKELKPMVFAGLYPVESHQYAELREALEKLRLNDASFFYEPETSAALGFGFRCGFLGLLHMEIVQERLEREYDMDLVTTAPACSTASPPPTAWCRRSTARPSCRTRAASRSSRSRSSPR
jgi:GTP-binding protein LepA